MTKLILAVVVYYSGLLSLFAFLKRVFLPYGDLVILMYHSVLDLADKEREYSQPGLIVSQQVFVKQMSFLTRNYNLLSLERLIELLKSNKPIPKRAAVITFDDGWKDNYLYAYPILKKNKVPATIFLATDFIGTDKIFWFLQVKLLLAEGNLYPEKLADILQKVKEENKASLSAQSLSLLDIDSIKGDLDRFIERMKQLDFEIIQKIIDRMIAESGLSFDKWTKKRWVLSWDEVKEMSRDNVDFGSHGRSHRILTTLSVDEVKQELVQSKNVIEERIGKRVNFFSYPNGDYNSGVKKLVQEAGYSCAVVITRCEKVTKEFDLFALRRIGVHEDMSVGLRGKFCKALFAFEIGGWNDFLRNIAKFRKD
jgi:peptidoglycan/xylan/chitin deacetylase (PgdA/CDA1 family)